jgi:hypothetical protein
MMKCFFFRKNHSLVGHRPEVLSKLLRRDTTPCDYGSECERKVSTHGAYVVLVIFKAVDINTCLFYAKSIQGASKSPTKFSLDI